MSYSRGINVSGSSNVSDYKYLGRYFSSARISLRPYNSSQQINDMKQAIIDALPYFKDVFCGIATETKPGAVNSGMWNDYRNAFLGFCSWAALNNVTHVQVGNELELFNDNSISDGELILAVKELVQDAKSLYPNLIYSYSVTNTYGYLFLDTDLDSLDELGINCYGASGLRSDFESQIKNLKSKFKDKLFVSEWGIHYDWSEVVGNYTELEMSYEVEERIKILKSLDVPSLFFCYRAWGQDLFGARKSNGDFHPFWYSVIESKNIYFDISSLSTEDKATANTKGRTDYPEAHKNRHGVNIIQGEWSNDDISDLITLGAVPYGDYEDGVFIDNS